MWFSSVQLSRSVMSDSLPPHESQNSRPPCPSPTPGVYPNPCLLSQWCHLAISFSVISFSSCPQYFPALGSFPMIQLFVSGGQSIGVSASTSVLPVNTEDWFPLGWTGWISLQSKGFSSLLQYHSFSSVQSLSRVQLFATTWIAARQASLSITISRSSLRLTSIESVMPSSHLILCRPLLLLSPIPPSIRVFSNESTLRTTWPK